MTLNVIEPLLFCAIWLTVMPDEVLPKDVESSPELPSEVRPRTAAVPELSVPVVVGVVEIFPLERQVASTPEPLAT